MENGMINYVTSHFYPLVILNTIWHVYMMVKEITHPFENLFWLFRSLGWNKTKDILGVMEENVFGGWSDIWKSCLAVMLLVSTKKRSRVGVFLFSRSETAKITGFSLYSFLFFALPFNTSVIAGCVFSHFYCLGDHARVFEFPSFESAEVLYLTPQKEEFMLSARWRPDDQLFAEFIRTFRHHPFQAQRYPL